MAAAVIQGVGAATALSTANYKKSNLASPRSLSERKVSSFEIRSDGSSSSGFNANNNKRKQLATSAVATKQDNVAASTASKPGCCSMLRIDVDYFYQLD